MMPATEKMHSGSGSGDPEKTGRPTKSYSDTPKFVPRKLHQAENFVDHLIL